MKQFLAAALFGLLAITAPANAEETPDFSGTFELNPSKGENLGMVAAIKETMVIEQTADSIVVDYTDVFQGNTTTRQVTYDLSGAGVQNFAAMGQESETVSSWTDGKLVTSWTSEGAIAGSQDVRTETRYISEDGQTMTVEMSRQDRPTMIMVYDRAE